MELDYENLAKYTLTQHGDHYEQQWWPLLCNEFSNYEKFWQEYIVPLTNRIDPNCAPEDRHRWIRLRSGIGKQLEGMVMRHYSTFHYLGRATKWLESDLFEHPEDGFMLLAACRENALGFSKCLRGILDCLRAPVDFLLIHGKKEGKKERKKEDAFEAKGMGSEFRVIRDYRNALLHNPILGRAKGRGRTYLPKYEYLKEVEGSWRKASRLRETQVVEIEELASELRAGAAGILERFWGEVLVGLEPLRQTDDFKKKWRLAGLLPITAPPEAISTSQSLAASGANVLRTNPASATTALDLAAIPLGEPPKGTRED